MTFYKFYLTGLGSLLSTPRYLLFMIMNYNHDFLLFQWFLCLFHFLFLWFTSRCRRSNSHNQKSYPAIMLCLLKNLLLLARRRKRELVWSRCCLGFPVVRAGVRSQKTKEIKEECACVCTPVCTLIGGSRGWRGAETLEPNIICKTKEHFKWKWRERKWVYL
jgi:hypothetical protein